MTVHENEWVSHSAALRFRQEKRFELWRASVSGLVCWHPLHLSVDRSISRQNKQQVDLPLNIIAPHKDLLLNYSLLAVGWYDFCQWANNCSHINTTAGTFLQLHNRDINKTNITGLILTPLSISHSQSHWPKTNLFYKLYDLGVIFLLELSW